MSLWRGAPSFVKRSPASLITKPECFRYEVRGSGTDDEGRVWAGHTGGSVGGTTFFRVYPEENLVVAVIANLSSVQWDGLPLQVAELFLDATD